MNENHTTHPTSSTPGLNDHDELERFLTAYSPDGLDPAVWDQVAAPGVALVMRAGEPTRLRVEKDIQLLGAVVAHLVGRGRPVTLDEALADTTLLAFDTSLQVRKKTRENKRGIHRRLQAVHRGLPWRSERRADGARVNNLVSPTEVPAMHRILATAHSTLAADPDAAAFTASVAAARGLRSGAPSVPDLDAATWSRARSFAQRNGWHLTQPVLRAVVTHEVLNRPDPVAVLIAQYALTRRDLDLALTRAGVLPNVPSKSDQALLRGCPAA